MTKARTNLQGAKPSNVLSGVESGWQVVGDVLMCWGKDTQLGSSRVVTFPRAFKSGTEPSMTLTCRVSAARFGMVKAISDTSATIYATTDTGAGSDSELFWQAIGEAADADKR